MRHPDVRPLKLYGGVAAIARKLGRCAIVPVAARYDFMMEQAPDAFMRVGAPILIEAGEVTYNAKELTNLLTAELTSLADRLHADVSAYDLKSYRRLMSGRGSINLMWDRLLQLARRARRLTMR